MFLWITLMPPSRAIAIAISDSVTVSIAAATSGMWSERRRVKRERVSTLRGCTLECRGTSSTSSNVSATVGRKVPWRKLLARRGFLNLFFVRGLFPRLFHRRLSRRGHLLEQPTRLPHRVHRPLDDVHRNAAGAQRILQRFRRALERRRAGLALRVLRLEELDVVEHLVGLLVGKGVELAQQAIAQNVVHGRVSRLIRSSTGLPRNRVRPVRTRAVT